MNNKQFLLGIDVGSTTVKTVITNPDNKEILYSKYQRHFSKVKETVVEQLELIKNKYGDCTFKVAITGSAGLGLANASGIPFVQEVHASFIAVKQKYADTDVVIELGGEDAKIIFLTGGVEQRMNGSCAGGTGAFIDQMATLLGITATQLDELSLNAEKIYQIASRCGVFAKSDIQPLLNQGAKREDISASIFQAVVDQTVSGLAQGRKIEGKVLFLGGPLSFLKGLRKAFVNTLKLTDENAIFPKDAPVFVAYGSSLYAENTEKFREIFDIIYDLKNAKLNDTIVTGERLFNDQKEYDEFINRHKQYDLKYADITKYQGNAYLGIDVGIVETVAHYKAASFFQPNVDFIIDIGGQDIKCFKIKNGAIDSIMLNEACSSGCGSFIQTFAQALGYDISEFARLGLFAKNPVELGSRCTVFMNSSVKQAQKDGATVEDISAGLSASIIKNAIYKVIRAKSVDELGKNIVVQGGTFLNDAVLRSFEKELGRNVVRPAVAGLMGAVGCALYSKEMCKDKPSTLISAEKLKEFSYTSMATQCKGCTAHCSLNIVKFSNGSRFISGNKCEKGAGIKIEHKMPNLYEYKYDKIVSYEKIKPTNTIGRVGIPRVLGFYEQIPLWHTAFTDLGFEVVYSEESSRDLYYKGQHTIPSDTVCYPAKLAHGHIESILEKGVDYIFYPCMSYNIDEGDSDNHYNCPVVAYYPELLKANVSSLNDENFIHPYIDLNRHKHVAKAVYKALCGRYPQLTQKQVTSAIEHGYQALQDYRQDIINNGQEIIQYARQNNKNIIVLAGRPYHIDKEINHGIHKLMSNLDLAVITEDSVAHLGRLPQLEVLNQWTYHSRLYKSAQYVTTQPDMQLVQLVSFGCGIDAITTDEVRSILERADKLYTQLKIDEISNLGAVKIRLRSLITAMEQKKKLNG